MLLLLKTLIFQIDIIYIIYISQKFLIVKNIAKKHIIYTLVQNFIQENLNFFLVYLAHFLQICMAQCKRANYLINIKKF